MLVRAINRPDSCQCPGKLGDGAHARLSASKTKEAPGRRAGWTGESRETGSNIKGDRECALDRQPPPSGFFTWRRERGRGLKSENREPIARVSNGRENAQNAQEECRPPPPSPFVIIREIRVSPPFPFSMSAFSPSAGCPHYLHTAEPSHPCSPLPVLQPSGPAGRRASGRARSRFKVGQFRFGFRYSDFLRISVLGFRISAQDFRSRTSGGLIEHLHSLRRVRDAHDHHPLFRIRRGSAVAILNVDPRRGELVGNARQFTRFVAALDH